MIVAGIGSRKGVSTAEVIAAIEAALLEHGLAATALSALATTPIKANEAAIFAAGERLGLPVIVVGKAAQADPASSLAERTSQECLTRSEVSQAVAGVASVSEAAALAGAGEHARLLGPRTVLGRVTCAIAVAEGRP